MPSNDVKMAPPSSIIIGPVEMAINGENQWPDQLSLLSSRHVTKIMSINVRTGKDNKKIAGITEWMDKNNIKIAAMQEIRRDGKGR